MFKKTITNEELELLPLTSFEGQIIVVESLISFNGAMQMLEKERVLGFDTETKPSFKKGKNNKVALLQLATEDHAFLFRINKIGMPEELAKLMANPEVIKVGAAIRDDIKALQGVTFFKPHGFVELQDLAKKTEIEQIGLKNLAAIVLNIKISKRQQLSNWENEELGQPQLKYAATDAWVGYKIFMEIQKGLV